MIIIIRVPWIKFDLNPLVGRNIYSFHLYTWIFRAQLGFMPKNIKKRRKKRNFGSSMKIRKANHWTKCCKTNWKNFRSMEVNFKVKERICNFTLYKLLWTTAREKKTFQSLIPTNNRQQTKICELCIFIIFLLYFLRFHSIVH